MLQGCYAKKYYGGWRWGMAAWEKYNKNMKNGVRGQLFQKRVKII